MNHRLRMRLCMSTAGGLLVAAAGAVGLAMMPLIAASGAEVGPDALRTAPRQSSPPADGGVALAMPAAGQSTLDYPVGERQPYHYDSGFQPNQGEVAFVVSEHLVQVDGAAWLRLYFGDVELEPGSFVRITSQLDNEIQELDARGLAMWSNTSAYFNGNIIFVELVAAPKTRRNRLVIEEVAREKTAQPIGVCIYPCGICGPDDRVSSIEDWSARAPAGRLYRVGVEHGQLPRLRRALHWWKHGDSVQRAQLQSGLQHQQPSGR